MIVCGHVEQTTGDAWQLALLSGKPSSLPLGLVLNGKL